MTVGFYAGSFDPFTNGHLDITLQALRCCDRLVLAIGRHATKAGTTPFDDRAALIARSLSAEGFTAERFEVVEFDGLAVDAARTFAAGLLVRGLRDVGDLAYEMQMAGMNAAMAPDIQTVFLPARAGSQHITATLVRQIAAMGGDVKPFVPEPVHRYMQERHDRSPNQ